MVHDRAPHVEACASLKTTSVVLVLGEAAGILASLSIDSNVCLKDIKYKDLKEKTCRKYFYSLKLEK